MGKWFEKNTASKTTEIQATVEFTRLMLERVNQLSKTTDFLRGELETQRQEINALQRAVDSAESVLRVWKNYAKTLFIVVKDAGHVIPPLPDEIADDWREMFSVRQMPPSGFPFWVPWRGSFCVFRVATAWPCGFGRCGSG